MIQCLISLQKELDHRATFSGYCEGRNFVHCYNVFSGGDMWTRSARDCWGVGAEGKRAPSPVKLQLKRQAHPNRKSRATAPLRNTYSTQECCTTGDVSG